MKMIALFLIFSLSCYAYEDKEVRCAQQVWDTNKSQYEKLTSLGEQVKKILLGLKFKLSNDKEIIYLLNNPTTASVIQGSICGAYVLSNVLCPYSDLDDERDAARHFLFSAYLACSRGVSFAREFTIAHEGNPNTWKNSSIMDIKNNEVAFRWSTPGNCRMIGSQSYMAKLAMKLIENKQLTVIKRGGLCISSKKIDAEFEKNLIHSVRKMEKEIQVDGFQACKY